LHCEDGPSLSYPDGFSIWAWHGLRIESRIIEKPETITVSEIDGASNAELKRVKMQRFGLSRYLLESNATEIHRDDFGILYRKPIQNDEDLVMVKVVNSTAEPDGTFKDYFLRVPPTMKKAKEAVAWTFEKTEDDYEPLVQT